MSHVQTPVLFVYLNVGPHKMQLCTNDSIRLYLSLYLSMPYHLSTLYRFYNQIKVFFLISFICVTFLRCSVLSFFLGIGPNGYMYTNLFKILMSSQPSLGIHRQSFVWSTLILELLFVAFIVS